MNVSIVSSLSKPFVWAFLLNCLLLGGVKAQGCKLIDKSQLAKVMAIDSLLVPIVNLEIHGCENLIVGDTYAGFVLGEQNFLVNGGVRAELAVDFPFVEGDTVEYRWSVLIPAKDAPGGDSNQWWLIAQWHDQPDPSLGQTWATFKAQSPPVAVHIETRNGVVGIGLSGLLGKKLTWVPVPTGVWLNFIATIRWSTGANGSVRFRVEDHPEFEFTASGQNMLNGYRHYFKAGQYRTPAVSRYSVIYMKNFVFRKL